MNTSKMEYAVELTNQLGEKMVAVVLAVSSAEAIEIAKRENSTRGFVEFTGRIKLAGDTEE